MVIKKTAILLDLPNDSIAEQTLGCFIHAITPRAVSIMDVKIEN